MEFCKFFLLDILFSNIGLLGHDFSNSFFNLVDAFQLHFCVFLHTLYCLTTEDQLEKNMKFIFHGKICLVFRNRHSLMPLNMGYTTVRAQ